MSPKARRPAAGLAEGLPGGIPAGPFRPLFWVDEDFRIREWPEATARALRVPVRAALGRSCSEVIGGSGDAEAAARCARCPVSRGAQVTGMAESTAPQATEHCAIVATPGPAGGGVVWLPLSQIVAGRATGTRLEQLVARGLLAERLGSIPETLEGLRRMVAADDCELFLIESSGNEVVLVDCEGPDREAFMERTKMPLGAGYPGAVTLLQKPIFTNDVQRDQLFVRQSVKRRGIRSFIGVPLLRGVQPLGYLGVGWRNETVPIDWGLRLLEALKSLVPIALPRQAETVRVAVPAIGRLDVRCFGAFELACDGQRIAPEAFKRRKAIPLLKILLLQRGAPVHRDRLVELLWPDAGPRAGANRLHGVVTALRSAIEAGREPRSSSFVLCRDDRYCLDIEAVHRVDLYDFLDRVEVARRSQAGGDDAGAIGHLEQALRLYRGDLFADDGDGADDDLFEPRRLRLRQICLDAARMLAGLQLRAGRGSEAIRTLEDALEVEPLATDLYETLISLLADAGRVVEARQHYERCRLALRAQLDMALPAAIRALEKRFA